MACACTFLMLLISPLSCAPLPCLPQNNFRGLSVGLIRRFSHQILLTLRYLKVSAWVHGLHGGRGAWMGSPLGLYMCAA